MKKAVVIDIPEGTEYSSRVSNLGEVVWESDRHVLVALRYRCHKIGSEYDEVVLRNIDKVIFVDESNAIQVTQAVSLAILGSAHGLQKVGERLRAEITAARKLAEGDA